MNNLSFQNSVGFIDLWHLPRNAIECKVSSKAFNLEYATPGI
jgi:hypothetical protein